MKKTYLLSSVLLSTLPLSSFAEIPAPPASAMENPEHTNTQENFEFHSPRHTLGFDGGSIAFDLIHDDKKLSKYRGVSCSSTTTDCREDFIIELRHNKLDNSWEMTLQITDLQAAYDSRELLNFPKQIVSLNRIIVE